ncbi:MULTISPECIES: histidine phosphatase family protein [Lactobacillus]|uniref:Histidine phosphatase family protein n=1 Tax=Lactobacillus xujianguonis TaxID=2495899 RepID=A0A437SWM8_9LACO|nr:MULTISPECIES: histidine phosphatase family protein [Lactobacillus]RVU71329.1 histidine phosphatase family protein [Lactobacillus xujianguonis]RVU74032.1 histidine phosphatase family protein [Lactobacillus xujianguonis]
MRTIYLVRHGQTLFNVHHKIQGTCDSPLTALGKAQAQAVRQYFLQEGINFDAAFCSTQERASSTLEIITNHQMPYTRLYDLHEKSHGEYEGQDEFMLPWRRGFSRINAAMEADTCVEQRMEKAITQIIDTTRNHDTILVVGHGTALRLFTQAVNPKFKEYDNCGVVKMTAIDDQLKFINYVAPS